MKNLKVFTAILAIALAMGGAFMTQADGNQTIDHTAMVSNADEAAELGYYRTIPNDPGSCTAFAVVPCNPIGGSVLCTWNIQGEQKQLYDANCNIMYYDPVQ